MRCKARKEKNEQFQNNTLCIIRFWINITNFTVIASSHMWSQTYGGVWGDVAYSLVETSDEGYAVAGYTQSFGDGGSDFWLLKTSDYLDNIPRSQSWVLPLLVVALVAVVIVSIIYVRNVYKKKNEI